QRADPRPAGEDDVASGRLRDDGHGRDGLERTEGLDGGLAAASAASCQDREDRPNCNPVHETPCEMCHAVQSRMIFPICADSSSSLMASTALDSGKTRSITGWRR